MALRWKIPELNAGLVDPQAVMQTRGEQGMQGFVPNSAGYATAYNVDPGRIASQQMQGYNPNNVYNGRTPVVAGGDGAGYQFDSREIDSYMADQQMRQQISSRISELETELASITNRIAELDKATPGLAKNPKEWEIAAKRAEIGDMSAYDNLMSRGNADSASASGIENELYNAEKLTWGLHSKSDEDIAIAKANIEASLRRAEEWAARTGKELPNSYYRLRKELASVPEGNGDDDMNSREYGNELALKIYRGTATDEDIEKGVAWAEKNPNSDAAKEILEAAKAAKGKTKEAKAKVAAQKKRSDDLYAQARDLSKDGLVKWWEGLGKEDRAVFKKHHSIDLSKGVVQ